MVAANKSYRTSILYWTLWSIYLLYLVVLQSEWLLSGEMWAEMATNYFPMAKSNSLLENLFATDAGYIPFPTRIIALIVRFLKIPAAQIPFFYTWSAILGGAFLVAEFCRRPFRTLVENDYLRMLTALCVLLIADFETRTFINFTYFSAFFIGIHTARYLCEQHSPKLKTGWVIPILILSKPAVLATLPSMFISIFFVKSKKVRAVLAASMLLGFVQIIQLLISKANGAFPTTNQMSLLFRVFISIKYFVGFLGAYVAGPRWAFNRDLSLLVGTLLIIGIVLLAKKKLFKLNEWTLLALGSSLIFFNTFLNVFALGDLWRSDLGAIMGAPINRGLIVAFSGLFLIMVGFAGSMFVTTSATSLLQKLPLLRGAYHSNLVKFIAPIFLMVWMWATGWFAYGVQISRSPGSPVIHNSNWLELSSEIDGNIKPLCVPINPPNWNYGQDCHFLNPSPDWTGGIRMVKNSGNEIEIKTPQSILKQKLSAVAILVRPANTHPENPENSVQAIKTKSIEVNLHLFSKNTLVFESKIETNIFVSGKLIYFLFKETIPVSAIDSLKISFSQPVEISLTTSGTESTELLWMGTAL